MIATYGPTRGFQWPGVRGVPQALRKLASDGIVVGTVMVAGYAIAVRCFKSRCNRITA
ncbi:MAG: hypothetical protein JO051_16585 [Acidobacteriaceae bacterium]|nr:hypothetical protein [Acidobacteriaceae bacterium]